MSLSNPLPQKFDLSQIDPRNGGKYSANLHTWLKRRLVGRPEQARLFEGKPLFFTRKYLGWIDSDGVFSGVLLSDAMSQPTKAVTYCYGRPEKIGFTEILDFWERYVVIGRCAIDTEHKRSFIGDESRWSINGDIRTCNWCNNCTQTLKKWEETVERSAWENVP